MMPIDFIGFYLILALYLGGACAFLLCLVKFQETVSRLALAATATAFALHTLLFAYRYVTFDYFPVTDAHQSFFFFAWTLVAVFMVFTLKYRVRVLGAFVTPLAVLFYISSAFQITHQPLPLPPVLRSWWLPIHSTLAFLGYGLFGVAFCAGLMYLIQETQIKKKRFSTLFYRLPALQTLDELNSLCLHCGFVFLTLGIITGSIWAEYAWGSYWSWDPKEAAALVTWLIYAALLHGRLNVGWRGKRAAALSILGFAAVLFTFLGVNTGLHSHALFVSHLP